MLAPEFLPISSGIGNYVVQMAKRMPRDVDMHILAPGILRNNDCSEEDSAGFPSNVTVHYASGHPARRLLGITYQLNVPAVARALVKEHDIDIVHSHSTLPDILTSPERIGVPIVTTVHTTVEGHIRALIDSGTPARDMMPAERVTLVSGPILKMLENRYYHSKRHLVTVSEWGKRMMAEEKGIDPTRIKVIHAGVDTESFSPHNRQRGNHLFPDIAAQDSPKVLFLSRLATRKGILTLLRAIPRVLSKTRAHFIIAGPGDIDQMAIPKEGCSFLGQVPDGVPQFLYAISDLYVLPSLYENLPVTILEAMASECAVVASDICGIPELITNGKNGILIPPNDPETLADSIAQLVENREFANELAREARRSVLGKFDWSVIAAQMVGCYEDIMKNGRAG